LRQGTGERGCRARQQTEARATHLCGRDCRPVRGAVRVLDSPRTWTQCFSPSCENKAARNGALVRGGGIPSSTGCWAKEATGTARGAALCHNQTKQKLGYYLYSMFRTGTAFVGGRLRELHSEFIKIHDQTAFKQEVSEKHVRDHHRLPPMDKTEEQNRRGPSWAKRRQPKKQRGKTQCDSLTAQGGRETWDSDWWSIGATNRPCGTLETVVLALVRAREG
jgi:hypothetical protein